MKKLKNQARNEIFRQMSLTLTLPLDVPVRPMDAKGLKRRNYQELLLFQECKFSSVRTLSVHYLYSFLNEDDIQETIILTLKSPGGSFMVQKMAITSPILSFND